MDLRSRLVWSFLIFLARHSKGFLAALLVHTASLRREGRWPNALALMAAVVKIEAGDYQSPERMMAKLRRHLRGIRSEETVFFFSQFAVLWGEAGGQDLGVALFELDLGLRPGDYSDRSYMALRLRERLQGFSSNTALLYTIRLANALSGAERVLDEIAVLEVLLDIQPADYASAEKLAERINAFQVREGVDMARAYAFNLAGALGRISRHAEGALIAQIILAIDASDYESFERIQEKLEPLLRSAEPEVAMSCVQLLHRNLTDTGRSAESLALLEAFLGIGREHYRDRRRLVAQLWDGREFLRQEPSLGLSFVLPLLGSMLGIGRFADALELLAADAGVYDSGPLDGEVWVAGLRRRSEDFHPHISTGYLTMAALVLVGAELPQIAVLLLESDTPLADLDWDDPTSFAVGLEDLLKAAPTSVRTGYVISVTLALIRTQNEERAALLVDVYLRRFAALDKDFLLSNFFYLVEQWFLWWGQDADHEPIEMCRMLLPHLRHSLSLHGRTLQDRERSIRTVADLRLLILKTGLYWAAQEPDSEKADDLRRTVLLWDLELAQRLLVERFLLTKIRAVPAGQPPVAGAWPLPDQEPPPVPGYLPESNEVLAAAGVLGDIEARG